MKNALPRLVAKPVSSFCRNGSVMDLAAPDPSVVCFHAIAATMSKPARFGGRNRGLADSVAQHSVMDAQAILNEKGSAQDAAFFLLHDGHEWALCYITRPGEALYAAMLGSLPVRKMIVNGGNGIHVTFEDGPHLEMVTHKQNQKRRDAARKADIGHNGGPKLEAVE